MRNTRLKDIEPDIIDRAWFTMSHLLLNDGAIVADMGCGDGHMTYAMAALNPGVRFIGIEQDKKIVTRNNVTFDLPNLEFKAGDFDNAKLFATSYLDAMIHSYTLHQYYSTHSYSTEAVNTLLKRHYKFLKWDGQLFIRDYSRPPVDQYVLLEIPDKDNQADEDELSDSELLEWFSEKARPRESEDYGGFFLEELPQRLPETRLFRLPYRWAYEFLMRKAHDVNWEDELPIEYTFFSPREFRINLRRLGARVDYSYMHWDDAIIDERFRGKIKMLRDNGSSLSYPATSYVALSRKTPERRSLLIHERRTTPDTDTALKITALRHQSTGEIIDVVKPAYSVHELLPFRINAKDGRLKICLHDGIIRSLTNAVPRNGQNLDRRRWSAHLIEALAVETNTISAAIDTPTPETTAAFCKEHLNLTTAHNATFIKGPHYYPAPDFIDDIIQTYYLEYTSGKPKLPLDLLPEQARTYKETGTYTEFDAQHILDAITIGLIPCARLEMQILSLYEFLGIEAENWSKKQIALKTSRLIAQEADRDLAKGYSAGKVNFKDLKSGSGQLRPVHSIFVDEGTARGQTVGVGSQEVDFVVHNEDTPNVAVIVPLAKNIEGEMSLQVQIKELPIPERHTGNGTTINAQAINLPRTITSMDEARQYVAKNFGVDPDVVIKMGESYFTHPGVSMQRIFPFILTSPPSAPALPGSKFLPYKWISAAKSANSVSPHLLLIMARATKMLDEGITKELKNSVNAALQKRFNNNGDTWGLPVSYTPSPSLLARQKQQKDLEAKQQALAEKRQEITLAKNKSIIAPAESAKSPDKKMSQHFANKPDLDNEELPDKPKEDGLTYDDQKPSLDRW